MCKWSQSNPQIRYQDEYSLSYYGYDAASVASFQNKLLYLSKHGTDVSKYTLAELDALFEQEADDHLTLLTSFPVAEAVAGSAKVAESGLVSKLINSIIGKGKAPAAKGVEKLFKNGELFEMSMTLKDGAKVTSIAEVVVNGKTLTLKDIAVYSNVGDIPNAVGAKPFVEVLNVVKQQAKEQGFEALKITGQRAANSTSANPGKLVEHTIKLNK